ncbi:MAG: DNA-deoxyinosine glycosylase [Clostridiaceae bacterium]
MEKKSVRMIHPIEPIYDENSRILILGSFPSVKSRASLFYYAHPQNRFWRLLASIFDEIEVPVDNAGKSVFLLAHKIALWDVIASCEITGSSDSSIRNVIPNDLTPILKKADIQGIFCNGNSSFKLYEKYLEKITGIKAHPLPSTSPANASWTIDRLKEKWASAIIPILQSKDEEIRI